MQSNDKNQKALYQAIHKLLKPLVRILLRNGIGYKTFSKIIKRSYVEVASEDFKLPGRKLSDSRISTITGLTRKDVSALKQEIEEAPVSDIENYNRAARVIYGWVHDEKFHDANKKCAPLPLDGHEKSFTSLVKSYSGDIPVRAILDELARVGVVEIKDDETIHLLQKAYIPQASLVEKLGILGRDVAGIISTIDHNIYATEHKPYFQRKIYYDNLPEEALPEIQSLLADQGQAFLEIIDCFMAERDRDINPNVQGKGQKAAGIGLYYFEESTDIEGDHHE